MSGWAKFRVTVLFAVGVSTAIVGPIWYYNEEKRPWYRAEYATPVREPTFEEARDALFRPNRAPREAFSSDDSAESIAFRWLEKSSDPHVADVFIEYIRRSPELADAGRENRDYIVGRAMAWLARSEDLRAEEVFLDYVSNAVAAGSTQADPRGYLAVGPAIYLLADSADPRANDAIFDYYESDPNIGGYAFQALMARHPSPEFLEIVRALYKSIDSIPPVDLTYYDGELPENLSHMYRGKEVSLYIEALYGDPIIWLAERTRTSDKWKLTYLARVVDGPMRSGWTPALIKNWSFSIAGNRLEININPKDVIVFNQRGIRNDSDGDGFTDYFELEVMGTDPFNPDTDEDGVPDLKDANPLTPASDRPLTGRQELLFCAFRFMAQSRETSRGITLVYTDRAEDIIE